MYIYDNEIILGTALLLNVCNQTIIDKIYKEITLIRICNTRYHTIINSRL